MRFLCAGLLLAGCHSAVRPDAVPPGATLACESSGKNAYDTYGDPAFSKVLQSILDNLNQELADNGPGNLGESFSKIGSGDPPSTKHDRAAFRGNLAAFLIWVYGGPTSTVYIDGKTYQGVQQMGPAHEGLGITSAQYDYFVGHIVVPALISSGVKHGTGGGRKNADDVKSCFAPPLLDPAFKASIVGQ